MLSKVSADAININYVNCLNVCDRGWFITSQFCSSVRHSLCTIYIECLPWRLCKQQQVDFCLKSLKNPRKAFLSDEFQGYISDLYLRDVGGSAEVRVTQQRSKEGNSKPSHMRKCSFLMLMQKQLCLIALLHVFTSLAVVDTCLWEYRPVQNSYHLNVVNSTIKIVLCI
jgi:hypothetical protein